ncbi:hypothetical protein HZS_1089, partial [Henneguya salminicola]
KMSTLFTEVHEPYVDPVFSVTGRFQQCQDPNKVNMGVGVYRDHTGQSSILKVVKKVEQEIASDLHQNKEYLSLSGLDSFISATLRLVFGKDNKDLNTGRIQGVQSLSGTGAYRLACDFLSKYQNITCFYCPDPTWPMHVTILQLMGIKDIRRYKYCGTARNSLAWEDIISTLYDAPPRSAIVLQACGHNPTGLDFTPSQWETIASIMIERKLIPVLDMAYLGLVTGCIETDSYSARLFHSLEIEVLICISYSKNMGLYNERVGLLGWYASTKHTSDQIKDRLCYIIRNSYSNPPAHGAKIVSKILNDPKLMEEWKKELNQMSDRILKMRTSLHAKLTILNTPGDWSFIKMQKGLFCFSELSKQIIELLEQQFHIYMLGSGRINISALTEQNIDAISKAIHESCV